MRFYSFGFFCVFISSLLLNLLGVKLVNNYIAFRCTIPQHILYTLYHSVEF